MLLLMLIYIAFLKLVIFSVESVVCVLNGLKYSLGEYTLIYLKKFIASNEWDKIEKICVSDASMTG